MANQTKQTLMFGAAALLMALMAIWSFTWLCSSILTVRPEITITQWENNDDSFDYELSLALINRLQQALMLNSKDANTYFKLARFYEYMTLNPTIPLLEKTKYQQLAEQAYLQAITQQPTWDYFWARLASFYNNISPHANNTLQVLSQTMLLGPYENETQKIIIPLIFEYWVSLGEIPILSEQSEKIVKHSLKFYTHANLTLKSANQFDKLDELEPLLNQQWQKNRLARYKREYQKEGAKRASDIEKKIE